MTVNRQTGSATPDLPPMGLARPLQTDCGHRAEASDRRLPTHSGLPGWREAVICAGWNWARAVCRAPLARPWVLPHAAVPRSAQRHVAEDRRRPLL